MRGSGHVIHWSTDKGQGMIHLGGRSHAGLLAFALGDCDAKLKKRLREGDIPSAAAIPVRFGVAIRKGGLSGAHVSLASAKTAERAGAKRQVRTRRRS